jgi:hypothetical protein
MANEGKSMKGQPATAAVPSRPPVQVTPDEDDTITVSFRIHLHLLAALDAKARAKSLSRSSLIKIGINHVLDGSF